jgi:hypothetical protein
MTPVLERTKMVKNGHTSQNDQRTKERTEVRKIQWNKNKAHYWKELWGNETEFTSATTISHNSNSALYSHFKGLLCIIFLRSLHTKMQYEFFVSIMLTANDTILQY